MTETTSKTQFFAALAKAQSEFPEIVFDSENPHFRSKFASLAAILGAVRPVLNKHGIAVVQVAGWRDSEHFEGGIVACTTRLIHSSGESIESTLELPSGKAGPQGAASSLTYARRIGLQALCGVVGEPDDDGNTASEQPQRKASPAPKKDPPAALRKPVVACAESLKACATIGELEAIAALIKESNVFDETERAYLRSVYVACKRELLESENDAMREAMAKDS